MKGWANQARLRRGKLRGGPPRRRRGFFVTPQPPKMRRGGSAGSVRIARPTPRGEADRHGGGCAGAVGRPAAFAAGALTRPRARTVRSGPGQSICPSRPARGIGPAPVFLFAFSPALHPAVPPGAGRLGVSAAGGRAREQAATVRSEQPGRMAGREAVPRAKFCLPLHTCAAASRDGAALFAPPPGCGRAPGAAPPGAADEKAAPAPFSPNFFLLRAAVTCYNRTR